MARLCAAEWHAARHAFESFVAPPVRQLDETGKLIIERTITSENANGNLSKPPAARCYLVKISDN
jgi:hypothetical protein